MKNIKDIVAILNTQGAYTVGIFDSYEVTFSFVTKCGKKNAMKAEVHSNDYTKTVCAESISINLDNADDDWYFEDMLTDLIAKIGTSINNYIKKEIFQK